ncbi:hypothetical protein ACFQZC_32785 [Streptacidiphilus monticola]
MERVFALRGRDWAVRPLRANGQPALAAYASDEAVGGRRLHSVQVFAVTRGRISRNVVFADPGCWRPSACRRGSAGPGTRTDRRLPGILPKRR